MRYEEGHILGSTFRIVGVIGQGGFATVYEAEHLRTGRVVAIKMLDQSIDDHEQGSVLRFRQEARIAAQLRSPSIVRVYTHGTTRHGLPWIAMERLRGVTLRHLLDRLAEADELGIIHRDLKPANIMITRADGGVAQPRILDFGLSRLEGSSITARGATVGTPCAWPWTRTRGPPAAATEGSAALGEASDSTGRRRRTPITAADRDRRRSERKKLGTGTVKGTGIRRDDDEAAPLPPKLTEQLSAGDDPDDADTIRD